MSNSDDTNVVTAFEKRNLFPNTISAFTRTNLFAEFARRILQELKTHKLESHASAIQPKCHLFTKSYSSNFEMNCHINKIHLRTVVQQCEIKNHLRTHEDVKMLQCHLCKKGFSRKESLQKQLWGS